MTDFRMTGDVGEDSKRFIAEAEKYIPKIVHFSDNCYSFRDADNNDMGILEDGVVHGELCEGKRAGSVPLADVAKLEGNDHGIRLYDGKGKQRLVLSWGNADKSPTYADVVGAVKHGTYEEWMRFGLADETKSGMCKPNPRGLDTLLVNELRYDADDDVLRRYDEHRKYWAMVEDVEMYVRSLYHKGFFDRYGVLTRNDLIPNALTCVRNLNTAVRTSQEPIGFKDGIWVIDGKEGRLIPHNRDVFVKYTHPFERFHTPKRPYSEEDVNLLVEYLTVIHQDMNIQTEKQWNGSCIYHTDIAERGIHLSWGTAHTGKSTQIEILKKLIGDEYCVTMTIGDLRSQFGKADIRGKLLLDVTEMSKTDDARGLESNLKTLTGGNTITSDVKYEKRINFKNRAKPMINTNNPPKIDYDAGLTDRLLVVEMSNRMSDAEYSKYRDMIYTILHPEYDEYGCPIYDDLTLTRISRFYDWAWEGYQDWVENKMRYAKSTSMIAGLETMAAASTPFKAYVNDLGYGSDEELCRYFASKTVSELHGEYLKYEDVKLSEFKKLVIFAYSKYFDSEKPTDHYVDGTHFVLRKEKKETKSHEPIKNSIQKLMVAVKEYVVRERLQTGDYLTMHLSDEQRRVLVDWKVIDDAGRLME